MSNRPWRQVVSINNLRQDVLSAKMSSASRCPWRQESASRCPVSSRSRQDVAYAKYLYTNILR